MRYVKPMENQERGAGRAEMEVAGGCTLCGGPVAVRFSRSRAVSVCRSCMHVAIARVHMQDGNLVFEQVVSAAA
jgi:hypothetical protein